MQKKTYTEEFDLLVKEALQDAEAAPSPRVWQAIESRLDAVAAPRQGFRRGWVAFAAAAALAAALVIPSAVRHNSNLLYNQEQELLALASPVQTIQTEAIPSPRALKELRAGDFRAAEGSAAAPVAAAEQAGTRSAAPVQESAAGGSTATAQDSPVKDGTPAAHGKQASEPAGQDAFAGIAFEENQLAKARRSVTLYAGGRFGGNESGPVDAAMAAKGSGVPASNIVETGESNYGIPFSLSLGVRYPLTDRLSVGAGVSYSYLTRTFRGKYAPAGIAGPEQDIRHNMQYVGIPVSLFFNVYEGRRFNFYVLGTGEAEWGLSNRYTLSSDNSTVGEDVSGTQFSAGLGLGVEFRLNRFLGLYLDPSFRYYPDCAQPTSIRTENPFMANIDAGLRFKF